MTRFLAWALRPNPVTNYTPLSATFYALGALATAALIIAAHVSAG